ncbi:MAG: hypothetical protein JRF33_22480 [Deltaproteobacteria bacterium]|nr:hypothetical protein [Deltaproteobacteria bacterium]
MRMIMIIFCVLVALPSLAGSGDDFQCPEGLIEKTNTTKDQRLEKWCETNEGKREYLFRAWYKNGSEWQYKQLKNGHQHGLSVLYTSNGSPSVKGKFDMGKKIGIWTRWWGNNQIKSEGRWAAYKPCGPFKCYDHKGKPAPCGKNLLFMHAGCKQAENGADCPLECPAEK